jgi:DNA (cytosine-5)-methyltransferase 1
MERTAFEENEKHVLYREYLRILALYKPAVFVMENVKGLLSATYAGNSTFERIISDLSSPTAAMRESMKRRTPQTRRGSDYTVLPLVQPSTTKPRPEDYLIAAENFGVPQRRHRVILLGVRSDLAVPSGASLRLSEAPAVRDVLADLPPLRSQLSKQTDGAAAWEWAIRQAMREFQPHDLDDAIAQTMSGAMGCLRSGAGSGGRSVAKTGRTALPSTALTEWIIDPGMDFVVNHETRKHIPEDLLRYLFVASYAVVNGAPVLPACRRLASTLACGRKGFRCRRVVRGRSLRRRVPWAALESAKTIRASGLATDSARVKRTHATSLAGG